MFTISKYELPRYWYAATGKAEERVGERDENEENYFDSEFDAVIYADKKLIDKLNKEYDNLKNRYSKLEMSIYKFRALWNKKIHEGLQAYQAKVYQAKIARMLPPEVKISYLPEEIPVLGERLAIGTKVYIVDNYTPSLKEFEVKNERIYYYNSHPEGTEAYYGISDRQSIKSTLKSSMYNQEIYLDKDVAVSRVRALLQQKIQNLQEQEMSL